jgi:hypothetical protein
VTHDMGPRGQEEQITRGLGWATPTEDQAGDQECPYPHQHPATRDSQSTEGSPVEVGASSCCDGLAPDVGGFLDTTKDVVLAPHPHLQSCPLCTLA